MKMSKERPRTTTGTTTRFRVACSNLYITINNDKNGMPVEVFTNLGKAGGCPSQSEAVGRLASLALRAGVEPAEVVRQMKGIRCFACVKMNGNGKDIEALSCPDAVAVALGTYLEQGNHEERPMETQANTSEGKQAEIVALRSPSGIACPECGMDTVNECGCVVCKDCGYSKCG